MALHSHRITTKSNTYGRFFARGVGLHWGNVCQKNVVHPFSKVPETCTVCTSVHWSCSGSWRSTLLRLCIGLPLVRHQSEFAEKESNSTWRWRVLLLVWAVQCTFVHFYEQHCVLQNLHKQVFLRVYVSMSSLRAWPHQSLRYKSGK